LDRELFWWGRDDERMHVFQAMAEKDKKISEKN
jgi:hypothetical protein